MEKKKILPPTYFNLAILLIAIVHFIIPILKFIFSPWNLIGLFPAAIGGALNIIADKDFKRFNTTVKPFEPSSALMTKGVFRLSRNPMYLGMALILIGEAILFGSISPLLITIIFMLLMDIIFIKAEEKMLLDKFEGEYINYAKKVRRWI